MATKIGSYTYRLDSSPSLISYAAVGSKMEAQGPMAAQFDLLCEDSTFGEKTWEKAESRLLKHAVQKALDKGNFSPSDMDVILSGDLLNQCIGTTYGIRELGIPFLGLYGACSTMSESLAIAAMLVEGGLVKHALAATCSHFCSAERQFRFPLEYGGQRPPTSQWTATAAGAAVVGEKSQPPYLRAVTIGTIEDLGITDANNMGAAMAPAACETLSRFFTDTCTNADNYDQIITGDLGQVGSDLLVTLMEEKGFNIRKNHTDCGLMIYDRATQDVHAGGSGCGCSASMLCAVIADRIRKEEWRSVLFMATGALLSPTSVQQGESIPGVAHLVLLSSYPFGGQGIV